MFDQVSRPRLILIPSNLIYAVHFNGYEDNELLVPLYTGSIFISFL